MVSLQKMTCLHLLLRIYNLLTLFPVFTNISSIAGDNDEKNAGFFGLFLSFRCSFCNHIIIDKGQRQISRTRNNTSKYI